MIGRNKNRTFWRVLKISRLEVSDLNILEDSTAYTDNECFDLLKRIHEGNKLTGGLKFVTTCYGIVGMLPTYMCLFMHNFRSSFFRTYGFSRFRYLQIFRTALYVIDYEEKKDWYNLRSYNLCNFEERNDPNSKFYCSVQFGYF